MAFGPGESRFVEEKRHWEKPIALSDVVLLDRERCIQCARCTRFADEIAGDPLITFTERGGRTEIATFPDEPFASYFSGNTVQICPVGALTAKPYRFKARPWDLTTVESSCTGCSVGCRVALQSTSNRLVRMLGVDSEPVNHGWLCDKGRYGFEYVHSSARITAPKVRAAGALVDVSWPEALDRAASKIRSVVDAHGPSAVALIGGARGTNEDAYLWARLMKGVVGTDNVDAQLGDGLPADVVLGMRRARIADLDRAAAIIVLAPDLKEELPVLYLRARRAATELRVPLIDIAARDNGLTPYASARLRHLPGEAPSITQLLSAAMSGETSGYPAIDAAAALLAGRDGDVVVILGRPSLAERSDVAVQAAAALAGGPNVRFLSALRRGNVHGALDAGLAPGFLPGRVALVAGGEAYAAAWGHVPPSVGLDTTGILQGAKAGTIKLLVTLGADLLEDFPDRVLAREALANVDTITVGAFQGPSSTDTEVFLPTTLFAEKAGTMTNVEGRVQRLNQKLSPAGTTMDDWRIAAELALRLGHDFGIESLGEVQDELARVAPAFAGVDAALLARARDGVVLPFAEHGDEVQFGMNEILTEVSWEPIPSGRDVVVEPLDSAVVSPEEVGTEGDETSLHPPATPPLPALALHVWDFAHVPTAVVPPMYPNALRLITGRTLYDNARSVVESPSIAGLAQPPVLLVNKVDATRFGVVDGAKVKVTSARTTLTLPARVDDATAAGTAFLAFRQDDGITTDLFDVTAPVIDVRVEAET